MSSVDGELKTVCLVDDGVGRPESTSDFKSRQVVFGLALLLAVFAGWIVADSLADIVRVGWNDAESSHILLVPIVFVWIVWVLRSRFSRCSLQGRWLGTGLVGLGWLLWAEGYRYQIQTFWHLGAILLVVGAFIAIAGQDLFWQFLPAWGGLLFIIPIPGRVHLHIAVPMEHFTASMTHSVAEVLGINSTLWGNQLTVNGVNVAIAEACSGLRMVITLLLACYVFAFVNPFQWWVQLCILLMSPVVAIVCNVIRLVPTLWVFGHRSHEFAETFHDWAASSMLVVAFVLLMSVTRLLNWIGFPIYREPSAQV